MCPNANLWRLVWGWGSIQSTRDHGIANHSAGTLPSSTAALVNECKSVTPSEAALTIRCAIFALVAGVRCDRSMRSTAVFSADLMSITNSGLNFAGGASGISDPLRAVVYLSTVTEMRRRRDNDVAT